MPTLTGENNPQRGGLVSPIRKTRTFYFVSSIMARFVGSSVSHIIRPLNRLDEPLSGAIGSLPVVIRIIL